LSETSIELGMAPHILASQYVSWLDSIIRKASNGKEINCVNIMCSIPKLGGTFHFLKLTSPGQRSKVQGMSSEYFKVIKNLDIKFPENEDIIELAEFGTRCPISNSIASSLLHDYGNGSDFPPLPTKDGNFAIPKTTGEVIFGLLKTFTTFDYYRDVIGKFEIEGSLSTVIQCLLGLLPQFNDTDAAAMNRSEGQLPGKLIGNIRWLSEEEKKQLWLNNINHEKPSDRAFWLLSVVESLQWPTESEFGIVDSLYSFLVSESEDESKNVSWKGMKNHLEGIRLFLEPITFYFNSELLSENEKTHLSDSLRKYILPYVNRLSKLSTFFSIGHINQPESSSHSSLWQAETIAQAFLNISSPKHLSCHTTRDYGQSFEINLNRVPFGNYDNYNNGNPFNIFSLLNNYWGFYEQTDAIEDLSGTKPFQIPKTGKFFILYDDDEINGAFLKTLEEANIELHSYLYDVVTLAHTEFFEDPIKLPEKNWYEEAFDQFYILFDKHRQFEKTEPRPKEFILREDELCFYTKLFQSMGVSPEDSILEIGIGYGRLAKKIIDARIVSCENYFGVDLSVEMIEACKTFLSEDNLIRCDMCDFKSYLPEERQQFNTIILAYTTFGCYGNENDLITLKSISDSVRPWGQLILEQHNPKIDSVESPLLIYEKKSGQREYRLIKTTQFKSNNTNQQFIDYQGHYSYFEFTNTGGASIVKNQSYCVRLYNDNWLLTELSKMKFYVEFYEDFKKEPSCNGVNDDAVLMICHAIKLPFEFDLMKKAFEGIKQLFIWATDSMFDRYKKTNLIKEDVVKKDNKNKIYRKIISNKISEKQLIWLSKMPYDRTSQENERSFELIEKLICE
jgi:SAM-dependent methyltransferase